jgi:hypothetical protein
VLAAIATPVAGNFCLWNGAHSLCISPLRMKKEGPAERRSSKPPGF